MIERRLRPELLALKWQRVLNLKEGQISVLDMSIAPIPIAMSVLQHGQLLLSKNYSRQLQEQQRIMSKWENRLSLSLPVPNLYALFDFAGMGRDALEMK